MAGGSRAIAVDGLVNVRDLGGLRRNNGELTPRGVFFRSENVDAVTPTGWEQLRRLGVRTVVDLRQPRERARDRSARPDWLTTLEVDLEPEEIVEDYLETVRLGAVRASHSGGTDTEPELEIFCQRHGTTTADAFRDALDALDLVSFFDRSGLSTQQRLATTTWRGAILAAQQRSWR